MKLVTRLLRTTMSSGCFSWCPLLMPWKFKVTETKSEVSNEHLIRLCRPSWQLTASRICLKMSRRSSWQRGNVPLWCLRIELWRQILRCGERFDSYPAISLTHICFQEEVQAIVSATKECTSMEPDKRVETNSKVAVRGFIHICLLSDALRPGIAWKWTRRDRLDNEGM